MLKVTTDNLALHVETLKHDYIKRTLVAYFQLEPNDELYQVIIGETIFYYVMVANCANEVFRFDPPPVVQEVKVYKTYEEAKVFAERDGNYVLAKMVDGVSIERYCESKLMVFNEPLEPLVLISIQTETEAILGYFKHRPTGLLFCHTDGEENEITNYLVQLSDGTFETLFTFYQ